MAQFNAGDAIFKLDNASDTLTDVSSGIQSVTLDGTINGATYHTFGSRWAKATDGNFQGTLTVNFYDDPTATTFSGLLRAWALTASSKPGARSFQIQTPDGNTGSIQYDFEIRLGGSLQLANLTAGSGDPHTLSVTFNIDGEVADSIIS